MDICVSSNFERYLFHLGGDDASSLRQLMEAFEAKGGGLGVTTKSGCTASPGGERARERKRESGSK
jgi:hypothetical protein